MLNFEIDPGAITDLVPSGTELDSWNGTTFISLVGFRFLNTRVLGVGIPFHKNFSEVNLRFYVRRKTEGAWRRGVVFIKEVVPRRAIAWVARMVYNENYVALPMRHEMLRPVATSSPGRATYEWRYEGRWQQLSLRFSGSSFMPAEDSQECFITEHHWGYARQRDSGTVQSGWSIRGGRSGEPRRPSARPQASTAAFAPCCTPLHQRYRRAPRSRFAGHACTSNI
jgi:uncharacterized protein YqjF (DUF2071 family)